MNLKHLITILSGAIMVMAASRSLDYFNPEALDPRDLDIWLQVLNRDWEMVRDLTTAYQGDEGEFDVLQRELVKLKDDIEHAEVLAEGPGKFDNKTSARIYDIFWAGLEKVQDAVAEITKKAPQFSKAGRLDLLVGHLNAFRTKWHDLNLVVGKKSDPHHRALILALENAAHYSMAKWVETFKEIQCVKP